jgi:hypothetical protein
VSTPARPETLSRRARWVYAGGALALVAILVLTWVPGGFRESPPSLETVAPDAVIATGPYEFTFTKATAQHQPKTSYAPETWKVVAIGTGRTTGEETIAPSTFGDDGMFVARDPQTSERQNATGAEFGDEGGMGHAFTPGLPPIPYRVQFVFSAAYRPGATIRLTIIAQQIGNNDLIQTDDATKSWRNDDYGYLVTLPVTVVPEETS